MSDIRKKTLMGLCLLMAMGSARLVGEVSTYASSMNSASMLVQTLVRPEALQRQENLP